MTRVRAPRKKQKISQKKKKRSTALKHTLKQIFAFFSSKYFKFLAKITVILAIISTFFLAIFIAYCARDLPEIDKLSENTARPHIIVRAASGEILSHYGDICGEPLPYGQIPQHLIHAVIATEDRRFFEHTGIDFWGILRAAYRNRIAGRVVQGGSTITQQLAKIIFLSPERTIKRKVQEALLSLQLERIFAKEQIITIYLNRVFLGHANYGIDAAARSYFGKSARDLTIYESAIIAGMLKAPTRYAPPGGATLALQRAQQVLVNMVEAGFINKKELKKIIKPLFISKAKPRGVLENPYFSDYVVSELPKFTNNAAQDLDINTTFCLATQAKLEAAITKILLQHSKISKSLQVAAIVMDKRGAILAMSGGRDYAVSQFNRATDAKRQPGSLFKIFVYLAALENGYQADQTIVDEPIKIGQWQPRNFLRNHAGSMSMIESFAYSINTIAVKLSEAIGREKVIEMAHRLGISDTLPNTPSIALGSGEVTLIDLVSAGATIANNGYLVHNSSIQKITNSDRKTIYNRTTNHLPLSKRVLNAGVIAQIKDMLAASVIYGTSLSSSVPGRKIYGKTGTSQEHRDAWFLGIVDDLTIGVWVGHDNNTPTKSITGGTIPALIFKEFVSSIN